MLLYADNIVLVAKNNFKMINVLTWCVWLKINAEKNKVMFLVLLSWKIVANERRTNDIDIKCKVML